MQRFLNPRVPVLHDCVYALRRGMSATAGLTATAGEGQKLWTTLLLGLADILLCINIWGHARDQQMLAAAKADSKAVRKQVWQDCVVHQTAVVWQAASLATMACLAGWCHIMFHRQLRCDT